MWITKKTQKLEKTLMHNPILFKAMLSVYKPLIQKEIQVGEITAKDKVLFIGGGSAPCSAILIREMTGAQVDIVDCDWNSVVDARHLIRAYNLSGLNVIHTYGETADYSRYTVVHMALQLTGKTQIINKIYQESSARILTRLPKKSVEGLYDDFDSNRFESKKAASHKGLLNVGSTILYEKAN